MNSNVQKKRAAISGMGFFFNASFSDTPPITIFGLCLFGSNELVQRYIEAHDETAWLLERRSKNQV